MRVPEILAQSLMPLADLVFPPRCPACGDGIDAQVGLCSRCWGSLIIPGEPSCTACNRPLGFESYGETAQCAPCLQKPPPHSGIYSATLYGDISRQLLLSFKHGGRIGLAPMLAKMIAARLPPNEGGRLIVPVPLHRWRMWKRGYNQAALLGRELHRLGHGDFLVDGLSRVKATPSLGGHSAKRRSKILAGAISVSRGRSALIAGREVLLVDDVYTSGATSGACVRALRGAGAKSVAIACFSRVLEEGVGPAASRGPHTETPETEVPGAT